MERALFVLTPPESKKLIAQAVCQIPGVKAALNDGIVALHPSSSTYFIADAILGHRPPTKVWVCGAVLPKGLCSDAISGALLSGEGQPPPVEPAKVSWTGHKRDFTFTWVFKQGKLEPGRPLKDVLDEMGPGDYYMKGVNAIDYSGKVGILIGSGKQPSLHDEVGGTIGRAMAHAKQKGFQILFPVGLEKLIPTSIEEASRETLPRNLSYSLGSGCYLLPGQGKVVTEVDAIKILSGATAVPVAAGGLSGAEGAVVLVVKGEAKEVNKAVEWAEKVKGARLPRVSERNCEGCENEVCSLVKKNKPWVV